MSDPDFPVLSEFERIEFPKPEDTSPEGILACGGNLSPGMLLSAYSQGAFPWYSEGDPVLWWNPDPRCVLFPEKLYVSRRMERKLKNGKFVLKSDTQFREVISACATIKRQHEEGTWINEDIIEAYCTLHEMGWAHSIEVYTDDEPDSRESDKTLVLAGGLYGISLGRLFFGESMFSRRPDASKAALIYGARAMLDLGIEIIDCQLPTPHLLSLGAEEISRADYMDRLESLQNFPDLRGKWNLFS